MQVRERFACCHDSVLVIDASFVQGGKHIDGLSRFFAPIKQTGKFFFMIPNQVIEALMRAAERLAVGRQNKDISGNSILEITQ